MIPDVPWWFYYAAMIVPAAGIPIGLLAAWWVSRRTR